jgi:hypothetical protein
MWVTRMWGRRGATDDAMDGAETETMAETRGKNSLDVFVVERRSVRRRVVVARGRW